MELFMSTDRLTLSMACCKYDRCNALFDGRSRVDGVNLISTPLEPEEAFHRAFQTQEFDISELSLSSFTMLTSRGEAPYIGIPAFVSRLFRHSGIYIRTDRGIDHPSKLSGLTIGLPEYQITASVWIRGILEDEYGVRNESVKWRQGGLEDPGREERARLDLPASIDLKPIPSDRSLSDMLENGEIDALISARAPSCYLRGAKNVDRMFPDFRSTEQDYFRRTKIFPIMHIIGIRRSIHETHPWVAVNLLKAFIEAKSHVMYELGQIGHLFSTLPWSVAEFQQTVDLMGADFWSYGVPENRAVLETFLGYHHRQGLSKRLVGVDELFAPSTLHLSRI
jgi:4,5-dihydroxyphthalate decarboxylase